MALRQAGEERRAGARADLGHEVVVAVILAAALREPAEVVSRTRDESVQRRA
jgi:hypothetical protein